MNCHEKLNYIEFPSKHLDHKKAFFETVFDWRFTDFGSDYTAFSNAGIEGGFFKSELSSTTDNGGALVIFYSENLEQTLSKIEQADGIISQIIFEFPGGRRFHFIEPGGNELAVWSDR